LAKTLYKLDVKHVYPAAQEHSLFI